MHETLKRQDVPAWRLQASPDGSAPEGAETLATALGCPPVVAELLLARGMATTEAARAFLYPSLEGLLGDAATDPGQMLGMAAAVERVLHALRADEPILVYGDYDVDGTTAIVLLKTAIERAGLAMQPPRSAQVSYHVPHRIREGYGMQASVLGAAAESGVRLVISVDTGIRAIAEAVEARSLGLDLIVTDHHLPDAAALPEAFAVINPAQPGCPYPNKHLCGAAVAFKLAQALLTAVAPETADPAPFLDRLKRVLLPSFLKLVAIATIADSVQLTGENRSLAALGLAALARPVQPGLRALMEVAKVPLDRAPTVTEVGFRIAPRINAAGRMDIAGDVVELFLTRSSERGRELAEKLDALNRERRRSEAEALEAIDRHLLTLVDEQGDYPSDCLVLDHADWHRGVLGILASRVVERTGRPALIVTHADGAAHGSGRSVPGFHLLDALTAAEMEEPGSPLFHRFGGHAHAVGFSLPSDRLPLLRARLSAYADEGLSPALLLPAQIYDAELGLDAVTPELAAWIDRCGPFGVGNPEPIFLARGAQCTAAVRLIQQKHIRLQLASGDKPRRQRSIAAVGWSRGRVDWVARCKELELGEGTGEGTIVDLLYRVRQSTYGRTAGVELELCALRI